MHIPKTSGMALNEAIVEALKPSSFIIAFDRCLFGDFDAFETISPEVRMVVRLDASEFPPNAGMVLGHIALSTIRTAYPSAKVFTVLREPRARLISHWLYWRFLSEEEVKSWGVWGDRISRLGRVPLYEFLSAPEIACQTDNIALRMLLWPHPLIPDGDFIPPESDDELLAEARRALETLDFFGAVEDLQLDNRLSTFLGVSLSRRLVNETRAPLQPALAEELTEATLEAVGARSRLDSVLWSDTVRHVRPERSVLAIAERSFLGTLFRYLTSLVLPA
jgi:hypothetical protein